LVFHAEPLFEQSIDVWSGDPVIKELYDAHNEQYEMDLVYQNLEILTRFAKHTKKPFKRWSHDGYFVAVKLIYFV